MNNNASNNASLAESNVKTNSHSAWLRKSVLNKSFFSDEIEGIINIIKPNLHVDKGLAGKGLTIRIMSLRPIYSKEAFSNSDILKFNKTLRSVIWIVDGGRYNEKGEEVPGGIIDGICTFNGVPVTPDSCKKPALTEKAEILIDLFNNTFFLFYKKVKSKNPELLTPKNWSNISETFTKCIEVIYYFTGKKYVGTRLCEKMTPLVTNINRIFNSVDDGRPILIQSARMASYVCGRGIIWGPYKTAKGEMLEGVLIHRTVSEANNSVNTSILANPPTVSGGSRRRRFNKTLRKRQNK